MFFFYYFLFIYFIFLSTSVSFQQRYCLSDIFSVVVKENGVGSSSDPRFEESDQCLCYSISCKISVAYSS